MQSLPSNSRIIIIGAGAAGCFCAIELKRRRPDLAVTILEAGTKPLAKLAMTGGGRCNLTNSFRRVQALEEVYPRGFRLMRRVLGRFSPQDTVRWWEDEGVRLVTQEDECIFPESQDAMQIVQTLKRLLARCNVEIKCGNTVKKVRHNDSGFTVELADGAILHCESVIVTAGGCKSAALRSMLPPEVDVTETVPSLFTLKIADDKLNGLMGTVVENVRLHLSGTRFSSQGTLLITDWGVSGPAVLKLSSYAAMHLASTQYQGNLNVNWLGLGEDKIREWIGDTTVSYARKTLLNVHPRELSSRLWQHILERCSLREDLRWAEFGSKGISRLVNELSAACYPICGRARFKEEFVTCGGVSLGSVDNSTLECKKIPRLYFAGEVLDIDAVTGGFNLQAAWSTAMVVASDCASTES